MLSRCALWFLFGLTLLATSCGPATSTTILNVSFDPTRELFAEMNIAFAADWQKTHGTAVTINQSHGGSGKQSRSVMEGLRADVVSFALAGDVDALAKKAKLLPADWQNRLPNRSTPFTRTIVFVVRAGNPHQIQDWGDLIKPGVQVITPSPKTSGGARWNYLAAWAWANHTYRGDETRIRDFIVQLLAHVPVFDGGARAATATFMQRGIGDVLLTWESEAQLTVNERGNEAFNIVTPSRSILAEPPVALIDTIVDRRGTRAVAEAYLQFLYTDVGQEIAARHHYRPRSAEVMARHAAEFPAVTLVTIDDAFGGWSKAQATHFAQGAIFDQLIAAIARP